MTCVNMLIDVEEMIQFMWWPALALFGFVLLIAVVVTLGMRSTGRYEREQRARSRASRPTGKVSAVAGPAPTVPIWGLFPPAGPRPARESAQRSGRR
jgi:hypothetical protein